MTDKLTKNSAPLGDIVARCVRDLEQLTPRDAISRYPLLAVVASTVMPALTEEQLATVISLATNRGLIDAAQKCRSCAEDSHGDLNLCERCYQAVLGEKFSRYA